MSSLPQACEIFWLWAARQTQTLESVELSVCTGVLQWLVHPPPPHCIGKPPPSHNHFPPHPPPPSSSNPPGSLCNAPNKVKGEVPPKAIGARPTSGGTRYNGHLWFCRLVWKPIWVQCSTFRRLLLINIDPFCGHLPDSRLHAVGFLTILSYNSLSGESRFFVCVFFLFS